MAPVPVFGPWGYDMGWATHPGTTGMYGMCMMGATLCRRAEKATRIIFVGGLPLSVGEAKFEDLAAKFGPIRGLDATQRDSSSGVFVSYYNARHAEAAVQGLPEAVGAVARASAEGEEPSRAHAHFVLPPVGVAGMENQGIIAVRGAGEDVGAPELKALFSEYGELRSVSKNGSDADECWVVEFFDTRDAERAMGELKGKKAPIAGWKLEYAPFSGLEASCQQPFQVYPVPSGYIAPGGVKHEDSGMRGGLETPSSGPGGAMWSMQAPSPYGWAPYPVPAAHHGSFGSEGTTPVGTSAAMPGSGPPVELPPAV